MIPTQCGMEERDNCVGFCVWGYVWRFAANGLRVGPFQRSKYLNILLIFLKRNGFCSAWIKITQLTEQCKDIH